MKYLKVVLPVAVLALLVASCGAKLPQADVDAATAAFNDAKNAQADLYAPDSFKAASDANDALQANLTAKEYGKTKDLAKAVVDASTKAKDDVAAGIEAAKADVAQLTSDINTLLPVVQKDLAKAVKAGKKATVDVTPIKATVDSVAQTLTDAQANANYADAKAKLAALKDSLTSAQTTLEGAGYKN